MTIVEACQSLLCIGCQIFMISKGLELLKFQAGCANIATRIYACANFSIRNPHQKCAHARILVVIFAQPTCISRYTAHAHILLQSFLLGNCTFSGRVVQFALLILLLIQAQQPWIVLNSCVPWFIHVPSLLQPHCLFSSSGEYSVTHKVMVLKKHLWRQYSPGQWCVKSVFCLVSLSYA